jgi:predicted N-formylglutamate amidohydrolase
MTRAAKPSAGIAYLVSCEHGGNRIPPPYRVLFRSAQRLLASHRGYDVGALVMARALSRALGAPLVASTVSRLLIELNRSPGNPRLYSTVMKGAPREVRNAVYERYYLPYRTKVETAIARACAADQHVLHLSSHSFTPKLDGIVRTADVGMLYDAGRESEALLCARWQAALAARAPGLRVRRNYPYNGSSDGLTTYLRTRFSGRLYSGIELEVNQRYPLGDALVWRRLRASIIAALGDALAQWQRQDAPSLLW